MGQFKYVLKLCGVLFTLSKKVFVLSIMQTALTSIQPIITVIVSARIVQQLIDGIASQQVVLSAGALVIFNFIFGLLRAFLKSKLTVLNEVIKDDFRLRVGQKIMKLPYERLEDPTLLDLKQQALLPIIQWGNFEYMLNEAIPKILGSIITIITVSAIVSFDNLLLLIPILIASVLCMFISGKRQKFLNDIMTKVGLIERKMGYFSQLAADFQAGKEIRLFKMDEIIMKKIRQFNDLELNEFTSMLNATTRYDVIEIILTQMQIFIVYGVVAYDVVSRGLPIGTFLAVTGLFANVGAAVFLLLSTLAGLNVRGRFFAKYFEFDAMQEEKEIKEAAFLNEAQPVEICNVSFKYTHTDKTVLSNINLTIPKGKKVAIVGENGSGKSTLIKLICGLLAPTEGEILIGGKAVDHCAEESVSAVFQDFKLFAFSIHENVVLSAQDTGDALAALERVGLLDDVKKLSKGDETPLFKSFNNDGVEMSGGQSQKLAIARAIYRNRGVILLDEPTAALDPKAEADIFSNFRDITTGKTAIFVSHRLSSCRFCDHIVVLVNGQITEQGTHDELMNAAKGKYKEMYSAQAMYYTTSTPTSIF